MFLYSKPYHRPILADTFNVYTSVFSQNACNKMYQLVPVLLIYLDKSNHSYLLALTNCICFSAKLHQKDFFADNCPQRRGGSAPFGGKSERSLIPVFTSEYEAGIG